MRPGRVRAGRPAGPAGLRPGRVAGLGGSHRGHLGRVVGSGRTRLLARTGWLPLLVPRLVRGGTVREAVGFALAGAAAYAADLAVFIWLRGGAGLGPMTAKALSFLAGCAVAYAGNALGTYRGRTRGSGRARRYGAFFAVNLAGALVQLACLGFSHYLLGLTTPRDDVVSWAGVGMVLATVLRFWGTRTLVFRAADCVVVDGTAVDAMVVDGTAVDGIPEAGSGPRPDGTADRPGDGGRHGPGVRGTGEGSRPTWTG